MNTHKDYTFGECATLLKKQDFNNLASWDELLILSMLQGINLDDEFIQLFITSIVFTNKFNVIIYNAILNNSFDTYIKNPWFIKLLYSALMYRNNQINKCLYKKIEFESLQKKSYTYWNDILNSDFFYCIDSIKDKENYAQKIIKLLFIKYPKNFLLFYKTNENKILNTNINLTFNIIKWLTEISKKTSIFNDILKNIKESYNSHNKLIKFIN